MIVGKYCDHLPLYRQSEIYAREGIELDRSTLAGWVGGASRTVEPLVDAIRKYVLDAMKIHADDIPVPVLVNDGNPNNDGAACNKLSAFVNDVNTKLKNGQLTAAQAALLIQLAQAIQTPLGC